MSARFECQDCDFTTASVQMAETHERRCDDHDVHEIEQSEPVSADDNAPAQAREVEVACQVMHDAYEKAAVEQGWETQHRSRKAWAEVPEANKATMRAAARALLDSLAPIRATERQEAARAAWDDGYFHGWDDESFEERGKTPNPYRADGVTGWSGT